MLEGSSSRISQKDRQKAPLEIQTQLVIQSIFGEQCLFHQMDRHCPLGALLRTLGGKVEVPQSTRRGLARGRLCLMAARALLFYCMYHRDFLYFGPGKI